MPWKNQGGGPWGSGPKGPWGSGPQPVGPRPPDLEDLLRRGQDRLQQLLPGGYFSGIGIALILIGALAIWGLSGFFRVQSEELGVVLRFGKHVRTVQPGLNYHLPYPIETVLLPKALRVSTISIGMTLIDDPARRGRTMRDVPEESLMLTGDENIVDVDFTVLWRIKPDGVGNYLFNIQNPEGTVKAVAESAMREVVGRSNIQPILTGARTTNEAAVQELMQKTLDSYGSGILMQQVQMQKVDPPAQVIDSFRDVQAARADLERLQNEAQTYANRVVPDARGRAAQIIQVAEGYKQQAVAEAKGQSARFLKVYDEYKKAPDVTRQRIYLETMERILGSAEKLVYDGGGSSSGQSIVPYLPLERADAAASGGPDHGPAATAERRHAMRSPVAGIAALFVLFVVLIVGYSSVFTVAQTEQVLVVRLGEPVRVVTEPGLNFKAPFIDTVISIDKRILDLENPSQEVIASDQKRLVVDAFARYRIKNALRFYQSVGSIQAANIQLTTLLNASLRRVLGEVTFITVVRDEREALMARIRDQLDKEADGYGIQVVDVRIRRADLPEQNSQAVYQRMQTERQREAAEFRAQGGQKAQEIRSNADREATVIVAEANSTAEQVRGAGDGERNRLFAEAYGKDPDFFAFYRSMTAYENGLKSNDTRFLLRPDSDFFKFFSNSSGKPPAPAAAALRRSRKAPGPGKRQGRSEHRFVPAKSKKNVQRGVAVR